MKKFLLLSSLSLSAFMCGQELISFEPAEGYTMTSIHGQNGWEAHPDDQSDVATNQRIVDGYARYGDYVLQLNAESSVSSSVPINTIYTLNDALPATDFVISFDVMINEQVSAYDDRTSNFYFSNTDSPYNYNTTYHIQMTNNGLIKMVSGISASGYPSYTDAPMTWAPGEWYRVKIEGSANGITYYINDEVAATTDYIYGSDTSVENLYFRRNNYGNSEADYGFIDYIAINNEEALAVDQVNIEDSNLAVYPNPVAHTLQIKSKRKVDAVTLYDLTGKVLKTFGTVEAIDVSTLKKGVYIIAIETAEGTHTQKIIKK